ncbi:MAG: hypothetical protein ACRD11_01170 [Terriglobia bacterium]
MDHGTLIAVFVVVAAVAIVIQMLILLSLFLMVWKAYKQVTFVSREARRHMDTVVHIALDVLAQSREPMKTVTANAAEVSRIVLARVETLDSVLDDILARTREQVGRIDLMITSLAERVGSTAGAVERGVLGPVREVAALTRGIATGFGFFLSHRRSAAGRKAGQDEEMFI